MDVTYNTPSRLYSKCLPLLVCSTEILQVIKRKGYVHKTSAVMIFVCSAGYVDKCDPVVLIVVCDKSQIVILMHHPPAEEVDIEPLHMVEFVRLQDNMCKLGRRQDLA